MHANSAFARDKRVHYQSHATQSAVHCVSFDVTDPYDTALLCLAAVPASRPPTKKRRSKASGVPVGAFDPLALSGFEIAKPKYYQTPFNFFDREAREKVKALNPHATPLEISRYDPNAHVLQCTNVCLRPLDETV